MAKKKARFNIGDRVRVLDGSKIQDYFGNWVDDLNQYVGNVYTVVSRRWSWDGTRVQYTLEGVKSSWGDSWVFDERGLIESDKKSVVYSDEFFAWAQKKEKEFYAACNNSKWLDWSTDYKSRVTIVNMSTGKCGKSYCNTKDTFNLTVGLAIAWAKYLGEEIPPIEQNYIVEEVYEEDKKFNDKDKALNYFFSKCFNEKSTTPIEYTLNSLAELGKDFSAEKRDFIYWNNGVTQVTIRRRK